jgi:hypothetical protein
VPVVPIFWVFDPQPKGITMHEVTNPELTNPEFTTLEVAMRTEAGMTTAEYTVGTLGACSIAAILIKLAQTPWFGDLVKGLLGNITGIAGF